MRPWLLSAFNLRALPLSYGAMKTFVAPAGFDPATTSEMNGMIKKLLQADKVSLPTVSEGWFRSIDLLVMSQTRVPLRHFAIRLVAVLCLQCRRKSIKELKINCCMRPKFGAKNDGSCPPHRRKCWIRTNPFRLYCRLPAIRATSRSFHFTLNVSSEKDGTHTSNLFFWKLSRPVIHCLTGRGLEPLTFGL